MVNVLWSKIKQGAWGGLCLHFNVLKAAKVTSEPSPERDELANDVVMWKRGADRGKSQCKGPEVIAGV